MNLGGTTSPGIGVDPVSLSSLSATSPVTTVALLSYYSSFVFLIFSLFLVSLALYVDIYIFTLSSAAIHVL